MYCVELRSWRVGSANASARYSENDITRRLRVKSSRTDCVQSDQRVLDGCVRQAPPSLVERP